MMCNKLLHDLGDNPNRRARYKAVMAIRFPDKTILHSEGIINGTISTEMRGENGFGYDPIFYISEENKTLAELGKDYKNKNSHRAKATKILLNKLLKEK